MHSSLVGQSIMVALTHTTYAIVLMHKMLFSTLTMQTPSGACILRKSNAITAGILWGVG